MKKTHWREIKQTDTDTQTGGTKRKQRAGMEITIKFYDIKEKLPEKSGDYLTINGHGYWSQMHYSTRHKHFNVYDRDASAKHALRPDYWAELPDIPKPTPKRTYYRGCYTHPRYFAKPEEFDPCPICKKTDGMWVLAQKEFEADKHEHGYSVTAQCYSCDLRLNEYSLNPRDYQELRDDLRQKWNRMGNRRTS